VHAFAEVSCVEEEHTDLATLQPDQEMPLMRGDG
jgi:hypothetical protein